MVKEEGKSEKGGGNGKKGITLKIRGHHSSDGIEGKGHSPC